MQQGLSACATKQLRKFDYFMASQISHHHFSSRWPCSLRLLKIWQGSRKLSLQNMAFFLVSFYPANLSHDISIPQRCNTKSTLGVFAGARYRLRFPSWSYDSRRCCLLWPLQGRRSCQGVGFGSKLLKAYLPSQALQATMWFTGNTVEPNIAQ